jgi:hypothetical protein
MGEFPPGGLSAGAISYAAILESWYANGYGGALAWRDSSGLYTVNWADVRAFADAHPCETHY